MTVEAVCDSYYSAILIPCVDAIRVSDKIVQRNDRAVQRMLAPCVPVATFIPFEVQLRVSLKLVTETAAFDVISKRIVIDLELVGLA